MEGSAPAMDLILDRIKAGLPFSAHLVAQASGRENAVTEDEVRRYRTLENWILKQGYESKPMGGSMQYRKRPKK